jgi:hypothetical protein
MAVTVDEARTDPLRLGRLWLSMVLRYLCFEPAGIEVGEPGR